jgi:hypothetical protein
VISREITSEHYATNQVCTQTTAQYNAQHHTVGDRQISGSDAGFSQW